MRSALCAHECRRRCPLRWVTPVELGGAMLRGSDTLIPYCGLPPLPSTLWVAVEFRSAIAGCAGCACLRLRRRRGTSKPRAPRTYARGTGIFLWWLGGDGDGADLAFVCVVRIPIFGACQPAHGACPGRRAAGGGGAALERIRSALQTGRGSGRRPCGNARLVGVFRGVRTVRGAAVVLARAGTLCSDLRQQRRVLVHACQRVRRGTLALARAARSAAGADRPPPLPPAC